MKYSLSRFGKRPVIAKKIAPFVLRSIGNTGLPFMTSGLSKQTGFQKMLVKSFLICLYCLLAGRDSAAQWSSDPAVNNAISNAADYQLVPKIASDGAGGAIITWQDIRNGNDYDIYARRIDATGAVLWTTDGVAICTATNDQLNPSIISDGAGGAIITWQDNRSGSADIYARRIDATGAALWTADGVAICAATNLQFNPAIVSDGAGGAIITWEDNRSGNTDIYARRIDATGAVLWTADGVAISTATNDQFDPTIVSDGAAGAIITWVDQRSGHGNIYARRIDATGTVLWTADGVAICTATNDQSHPIIVSDGAGGAVITWEDTRNGDYDIYTRRIDATGAVLWAADGVAICTATSNQFNPTIVPDGAGGAIITWSDIRNGNDYNIYARRIDATGAVLWTPDGVAICTATNDQLYPRIVSDNAGGAIITWQDSRNNVYDNIYAQRIDGAGAILWTINSVAVGTGTLPQSDQTIISDGAGGAIITWQDFRNGNDYDIYAQNVNANGTLGNCIRPSISGEPAATQLVCKNAAPTDLTVTATGDGLTYQWYSDNNKMGFNGALLSAETNSSFTPPTGTPGTFYYYVIVTGDCGKDTSDYATVIINPSLTWYLDADADGYGNPYVTKKSCTKPPCYVADNTDCNDWDKYIHSPKTYYKDYDKDGYGDADKAICVCSSRPPYGYVRDHTDCNDHDKKIHSPQTYYRDYDKDGYGDPDNTKCVCSSSTPSGYVKDHTDCNDRDKKIHSSQTYYKDYDKDGYGDADSKTFACSSTPPYGYVKNRTDCNDHNKNVHPGAREIAGNYVDDNCNGKRDEKTSLARGGDDNTIDDEPGDLPNITGELKVNVLPNPSPNYFTINIKGGSDMPVQVSVTDITGRLLEVKNNVAANNNVTIGHSYRPGVYLVEVMQGNERVVIKCIKQ